MPPTSDDPNVDARQYNAVDDSRRIRILDSTLREGEQHPGVSFSVPQRIRIAEMLDAFGVDQIEINPAISPDQEEATKVLIKQSLRADVVVHGRATVADLGRAIACDASWSSSAARPSVGGIPPRPLWPPSSFIGAVHDRRPGSHQGLPALPP